MTHPGIEPQSLGPLASTLPTKPMGSGCCGVMVIIIRNEHGKPSSNPERRG